jgi:hypothetical protein
VALLANGSLSHQLWQNRLAAAGNFKISSKFNDDTAMLFGALVRLLPELRHRPAAARRLKRHRAENAKLRL